MISQLKKYFIFCLLFVSFQIFSQSTLTYKASSQKTKVKKKRPSLKKFIEIITKEGITTHNQYIHFRKRVGGKINGWSLPSSPLLYYKDEWKGWPQMTTHMRVPYLSYEEFKKEVSKHVMFPSKFMYWRMEEGGVIKGKRIPSNPNVYYKDQWEGWSHVIRKPQFMFYDMMKKVLRKNNIQNSTQYEYFRMEVGGIVDRYRLPSNPHTYYKGEWEGWAVVTGRTCESVFK